MNILRGTNGQIINVAYIVDIKLSKIDYCNKFCIAVNLINGITYYFGSYDSEELCINSIEQIKNHLINDIADIKPDIIKLGSIVQLKSGGPFMIVEKINEENNALCIWFDEKCNKKEWFSISSLNLKN